VQQRLHNVTGMFRWAWHFRDNTFLKIFSGTQLNWLSIFKWVVSKTYLFFSQLKTHFINSKIKMTSLYTSVALEVLFVLPFNWIYLWLKYSLMAIVQIKYIRFKIFWDRIIFIFYCFWLRTHLDIFTSCSLMSRFLGF